MTTPTEKPTGQPAPQTGMDTFKNSKLSDQIASIHKALVVDVEVKKIPESTFVKEILPILTGEVVSTEFPLLMAAVAGTPFSEVDVIDDAGNTLFRMPALLERNIISHVEASKRGSMASMLITAEMMIRQSPRRAQNYLEHEFNGRGISQNREEIIKQRQERWNVILARYGKSLTATGEVKEGTSLSSDNKDKPGLDFDNDELL